MSRFVNRKTLFSTLVVLALVAGFVGGLTLRSGTPTRASGLKYATLGDCVKYMNLNHKAPFDRDGAEMPQGAAKTFAKQQVTRNSGGGGSGNIKVNQDRNPWPKAELGAAVDPSNGNNYVVMANDFRENYDHQFYHVSTDGGTTWTDDSMVGGADPVTGFIPLTFQSDPGVAFDTVGHSFISTITGNLIFDFTNGYQNFDTEIEIATGYAHGRYTSLIPTPIDDQPCYGTFTSFFCPAQLDKPLITVDTNPHSPNKGAIYVYYTLFCNGAGPNGTDPCVDGTASVPPFSSAILVSSSAGAGLPFSAPALVSGSFTQEQFSSMVIDSTGTPHIFFDDFSSFPNTNMYESTLTGGSWVVNPTPVASFVYNGLNNINWGFRDNGAAAPGCGGQGNTAYCAFSANQIGSGKTESTPSVYLATVNLKTGTSSIARVNNDAFNDSKDHFFGWATATSKGVYVGFYSDRNDRFNTKVQYWVAKSTDGGKTFPTQMPVSTAQFNPCVGFPGCGFFGDYVQLVSGPDSVVHAAWSDTRDDASMQIYTQAITW